jgi:hypothetical protein
LQETSTVCPAAIRRPLPVTVWWFRNVFTPWCGVSVSLQGGGFLHVHASRYKKLRITMFKPARQPATVRAMFRPA